jgi:hypothetical protein
LTISACAGLYCPRVRLDPVAEHIPHRHPVAVPHKAGVMLGAVGPRGFSLVRDPGNLQAAAHQSWNFVIYA